MKKMHYCAVAVAALLAMASVSLLQAAEPAMLTYCNLPPFLANTTPPNILIMLDNSGSMNFNAYGTYPGDGGLVADGSYIGPPDCGVSDTRVANSTDDAEERVSNGTMTSTGSLDLINNGSYNQLAGLRFQNVFIPAGSTITKAYIVFTSSSTTTSGATSLTIKGQNIDDAPGFGSGAHNISNRTTTSAAVAWDSVPAWNTGNVKQQTPDLSGVVQEIVNLSTWKSNNDMVFIISGSGRRVAQAYDNSPSNAALLHVEFTPATCQQYYGYFNPDWFYKWDNNKFVHAYKKISYGTCQGMGSWLVQGGDGCLTNADIQSEQLWDGNWMNWATMRRIDVARKVLMGGLATARTGGGNQTVYGETPAQSSRTYMKNFDSTLGSVPDVSPYHGNYYYGIKGGSIYVSTSSANVFSSSTNFKIAVDKQEAYEPNDFYEGNVAGVLQKVGSLARWGNEWFNDGSGSNNSGGRIANSISSGNITNLITDLQNTGADTWTPLAEAFYVATQYFKRQPVASGLDYANNVLGALNDTNDPYYNGHEFVPCAQSFVILFTDGASTMDSKIPAAYKDYDGDGKDNASCNESTGVNCDYPDGGTDYLDDIALYAHTTDLRSDLDGDQSLYLYPIYAFGNDPMARQLLIDAAKNGGFEDENDNGKPDLDTEWDGNDDGLPDTYFEATDGAKLEASLLKAIYSILEKSSSGTAVSVLATSSEGEGNVVQAYFNPQLTEKSLDGKTIEATNWIGFLQSIWVDQRGNLREDTIQDGKLDITQDRVLKYRVDDQGNTVVDLFAVSADVPYPDLNTVIPSTVKMNELKPVWEAGSVLAATDPAARIIYTSLDGTSLTDFSLTNSAAIKPFLGVRDAVAWSYLGTTPLDRAENLIRFERGVDSGFVGTTLMRNRTIHGQTLKLGDIIHATPVSVAAPPDRYGLIYSDASYEAYNRKYTVLWDQVNSQLTGRETMVYVGANDGMLHAFTSWVYDRSSLQYKQPGSSGVAQTTPASPAGEKLGAELWAYIPQALLPHLKWLADRDYCHVDYVDLQPKVVDARIFTPDATHPNGWGTVLIGGMRLGGKEIDVTDEFGGPGVDQTRTFKSSYFALDITNPRQPVLLWDRTYQDLGLTSFFPSVIKVGDLKYDLASNTFSQQDDKWMLVLGSGPSSSSATADGFKGVSATNGHVFILDLLTGNSISNNNPIACTTATISNATCDNWLFETADANGFMGGAASFDYKLNYNVDAIYLTESHQLANGTKLGALYKVTVPWLCDNSITAPAGCTMLADYGNTKITTLNKPYGSYTSSPLDATNPWTMAKLFDAPRPITAPPSLSLDSRDRVWAYFGTGRYFNLDDKYTTDTEYLYGVMDPFFNREHAVTPGFFNDNKYRNYAAPLTLAPANLLNADEFTIFSGGAVKKNDVAYGNFAQLVADQAKQNGWQRTLTTPGERALAKPIVFGGYSLFTSFVPNTEICDYGGNSFLYALYYETGTPFERPAFSGNAGLDPVTGEINEKIDLGVGLASSPGIHVGQEAGGKAMGYVQQSTGEIQGVEIDPAFKVRSGLRSWQDLSIQ